ncbi:MAG: hypothetical protein ABI425_00940 [Patescibacteria group bacterium]
MNHKDNNETKIKTVESIPAKRFKYGILSKMKEISTKNDTGIR